MSEYLMSINTRRLVVASLVVTVAGLGVAFAAYLLGVSADRVSAQADTAELRLVPDDAAFVGYADVQAVVRSRLRDRARDTLPLPDSGREQFEIETGINVERDIDRVVAYLAPVAPGQPEAEPEGLVLARGRFDPSRIESLMRERGATVETHAGRRVLVTEAPLGSGSGGDPAPVGLAFIEPGLAAVGSPRLVRGAIDRATGGANVTGNDEIMAHVRALAPADIWAVGRFEALGGSARLPDGIAGQLPPLTWLSLSLRISDGLGGVVQAVARDDAAAESLRDVLKGFLAFGRMQAPSGPGMEQLLQSIELRGTGRTVELAFEAPVELLELLQTPSVPSP